MFKIKRITLEGFKSIQEPITVDIDGPAGLTFLTGNNKVDAKLTTNGTGKTTILDGISWTCFDKTSRGLRASDIDPWSGYKPTRGIIVIQSNDKLLEIARTRNPNSLRVSVNGGESKSVDQGELEELLGFSYDSFHHAILVASGGRTFFDMTPGDKAKIFSSIMDLDHWLEKSQAAADKTSSFQKDIDMENVMLARKQAEADTLKALDYSDDIKNFEEDRKEKLAEMQVSLAEVEKGIQDIAKDVKSKEEAFVLAEEALATKQESLTLNEDDSIAKDLRKVRDDHFSCQSEIRVTESSLKKAEDKLEDMQNADDLCPECGQKVTKKHLKSQEDQLKEECKELGRRLDELETRKAVLSEQLAGLESKESERRQQANNISQTLHPFREAVSDAKISLQEAVIAGKSANRKKVSLENDMASLKEEPNPFTKKQQEAQEKLGQVQIAIAKQEDAIADLEEQRELHKFWIKGFKDIRTLMISEALLQFELEVNNALDSLGLLGWEIKFSPETETKSGTIRKEFGVFIKSPSNAEAVSWDSWSGGESQRLRVAGTLGLMNLILTRKGMQSFTEFWDEPSSHLSAEGQMDIIETLKQRAKDHKKNIWLVDHNSFNHGSFQRVVTVEKSDSGSRVLVAEGD